MVKKKHIKEPWISNKSWHRYVLERKILTALIQDKD